MADKEARVRLTLSSADYTRELQQSETKTKNFGRTLKSSLGEAGAAGVRQVKSSLGELGSSLKSIIGQAATLGGAVGAGALAKQAQDMQGKIGLIAFQLERATGKAWKFETVQQAIADGAKETSRTHDEMADAMRVMLDRGADPSFAIKSLGAVGQLMNTTGMDAERVGRVLAGMSNAYGVSGNKASQMLDGVTLAASKGHIQMEEFFEDFNEFGSIAQHAGLKGEQGMALMMATIAKMGPELNGTTSEISSGLDIMTERLRDVGIVEKVMKDAGQAMSKGDKAEFSGLKDARKQAEFLMSKGPDVMKAFQAEFTGREEKSAFNAWLGPYFDKVEQELKAGKSKAEASAAGMAAVKANMDSMVKPFADQGRIAEQSARAQKRSAAKMREALNRLTEAITTPEAMEALDSLSENLPALAKMIASVVDFGVKNPAAAIAGLGAGKVALSFGQGAMANAGTTIGTTAGSWIKKDVAARGLWKTAGMALGVAAATYIAYQVGKSIVQKATDEDVGSIRKQQSALATADAATRRGASGDEKTKALARAKAALKASEAGEGAGIFSSEGTIGRIGLGAGVALNKITLGAAGIDQQEGQQLLEAKGNREAKLRAVISSLEKDLAGSGKANKAQAQSADAAAKALDRLASSAGRAQGANGLPGAAGNTPGSAPR